MQKTSHANQFSSFGIYWVQTNKLMLYMNPNQHWACKGIMAQALPFWEKYYAQLWDIIVWYYDDDDDEYESLRCITFYGT